MTDNSPATDEELRALIGKALEPFASFAQNINKDGWVSNIHREPISNWFGPSDFRSALEALNAASRIRAETAKNSGEAVRRAGLKARDELIERIADKKGGSPDQELAEFMEQIVDACVAGIPANSHAKNSGEAVAWVDPDDCELEGN